MVERPYVNHARFRAPAFFYLHAGKPFCTDTETGATDSVRAAGAIISFPCLTLAACRERSTGAPIAIKEAPWTGACGRMRGGGWETPGRYVGIESDQVTVPVIASSSRAYYAIHRISLFVLACSNFQETSVSMDDRNGSTKRIPLFRSDRQIVMARLARKIGRGHNAIYHRNAASAVGTACWKVASGRQASGIPQSSSPGLPRSRAIGPTCWGGSKINFAEASWS